MPIAVAAVGDVPFVNAVPLFHFELPFVEEASARNPISVLFEEPRMHLMPCYRWITVLMRFCVALALCVCAGSLHAQHRVDPHNTYSRIIAVVPMVGKGTPSDPVRPQYAPWPPSPNPSRTTIMSSSHQMSDDGRFALVEFVAQDRSAFQAIFTDKTVLVFEKGKDKKDDIEKALKKFKKDFDLSTFGMVHP
jgi:hypothetical protein